MYKIQNRTYEQAKSVRLGQFSYYKSKHYVA